LIIYIGGVVGDWLQTLLGGIGRIFGGQDVNTLKKHPYMAVVVVRPIPVTMLRDKIKIGVCSAAILTPNKAITGATCFQLFSSLDM
jgi:hypothetical protein